MIDPAAELEIRRKRSEAGKKGGKARHKNRPAPKAPEAG